jgi:hypothetical protein
MSSIVLLTALVITKDDQKHDRYRSKNGSG